MLLDLLQEPYNQVQCHHQTPASSKGKSLQLFYFEFKFEIDWILVFYKLPNTLRTHVHVQGVEVDQQYKTQSNTLHVHFQGVEADQRHGSQASTLHWHVYFQMVEVDQQYKTQCNTLN